MRRQTGNGNFGREKNNRAGGGSKFGKREGGQGGGSRFSNREGSRDGPRREGGFERRDSGRSSFGRRDSPLEMHRVTCDKCGKSCEVPFRPTGDKPVYCSECFRKNDGGSSERRPHNDFPKSDYSKPAVDYRKDLDEINEKLDKIIESLGL